MPRQLFKDYLAARAAEEERLAAACADPVVRSTHELFAATYRAHAGPKAGKTAAAEHSGETPG